MLQKFQPNGQGLIFDKNWSITLLNTAVQGFIALWFNLFYFLENSMAENHAGTCVPGVFIYSVRPYGLYKVQS